MKLLRAFTLMEMLLVVAVLAVMASVAVYAIRQQTESQRERLVAQELQQVAAAAIAYRVDEKAWPAEYVCSNTGGPSAGAQTFINNYVPNANIVSRLGYHFCWGWDNGNPSNGGDPPAPVAPTAQSQRFYVALEVPHNMATAILSDVPNARYVENPDDHTLERATPLPCPNDATTCYVRMSIPTPGPSIEGGSGGQPIAGGGTCDSSSLTAIRSTVGDATCSASQGVSQVLGDPAPEVFTIRGDCQAGYQGVLSIQPMLYRAARRAGDAKQPRPVARINANLAACSGTGANIVCQTSVQAWSEDPQGDYVLVPLTETSSTQAGGELRAHYVLYCMPTSTGK